MAEGEFFQTQRGGWDGHFAIRFNPVSVMPCHFRTLLVPGLQPTPSRMEARCDRLILLT